MSTSTLANPVEVQAPLSDATIEAAPAVTHARTGVPSSHPHYAPVDWRRSSLSAKDKVVDACTAAVGGPALIIGSVVGACGLAVGGAIVLASQRRNERRYRAQPQR